MFYLGQDRARRQSLGIARSADGVIWEKLRANPILEPGVPGAFDENGLGEPAVWTSGSQWWMLTPPRKKEQRRMGLAHSVDGRSLGTRPELHRSRIELMGQSGDLRTRVWSKCPTDRSESGSAVGDVARPDQGLHGQNRLRRAARAVTLFGKVHSRKLRPAELTRGSHTSSCRNSTWR